MKKILLIALMFVSFIGYSQVTSDTTLNVSTVYYELSWDSSYCVQVENGVISVDFGWMLIKQVDGYTTKTESHSETYDISDKPTYIDMVLSPALVNAVTKILEGRRDKIINSHY